MNSEEKTALSYARGKRVARSSQSLDQLFLKTVQRFPQKTALLSTRPLEAAPFSPGQDASGFCFLLHPLGVRKVLSREEILYKSTENICILCNSAADHFLRCFDGTHSLAEISRLSKEQRVCTCEWVELEQPRTSAGKENFLLSFSPQDTGAVERVAKHLWEGGFLCVQAYKLSTPQGKTDSALKRSAPHFTPAWSAPEQPLDLLLLGDKPGIAGVGILYLASYLTARKLRAKCLFYDNAWNQDAMRHRLKEILSLSRPRWVGLSMKWFVHMARIEEMARMIKQIDPSVRIVVGGDSASYFCQEVIRCPAVDAVITGDGERGLYELVTGCSQPTNCLWKEQGVTVQSPRTGCNDQTTSLRLRPFHEILIDPSSALFTNFYLPTEKGCTYDCIQCGGNCRVQQTAFHRTTTSYRRPAADVRADLSTIREEVLSIFFSLSTQSQSDPAYFEEILSGLDLSHHFCALFSTGLPHPEVVSLACKAFGYVRVGIDLASLSERHRNRLSAQGQGKPQPSDQQILSFLRDCDRLPNCQVDLHTIACMPFYDSQDQKEASAFLQQLFTHPSFHTIEWGRLHAQPGALLSLEAPRFGMLPAPVSYDDFLKYSKKNMQEAHGYPPLQSYHYPYLHSAQPGWDKEVLLHYLDLSARCLERRTRTALPQQLSVQLSYQDLDQLSDQGAQMLRQAGMGPGKTVAVQMEDRLLLSIAILSCIKAGCEFLPIDTQLQGALEQGDNTPPYVFLTLTDSCFNPNGTLIHLPDAAAAVPSALPPGRRPLYRISSSGTTGAPHSIRVAQDGVVNYILWRCENYALDASAVILQLLSEAFDGFYANFFTSLVCGATLIIPSREQRRDFLEAGQLIERYGVTHTSLVPSLFALLLQQPQQRLHTLRSVVLAGETCPAEVLRQAQKILPNSLLINEYGPAENSICSTVKIGMDPQAPHAVGRPIDNVDVYVLDPTTYTPCPIGQEGEICVAGAGLFLGYDDRNAPLICTSFGEMVYPTGDMGFYQPDGMLYFTGRRDRQIKLGGLRVQPERVEHALLACPGIREAAVKAYGNRLDAYLSLQEPLTEEQIRLHLRQKLPPYLLPASLFFVPALPRTGNAKVDYAALIPVSQPQIQTQPTTQTQALLLRLWTEEIGKETIGLDENLFDAGANSLMLMKVYSQLSQLYPNRLRIADLFSYHTIRSLADYLDTVQEKNNTDKKGGS